MCIRDRVRDQEKLEKLIATAEKAETDKKNAVAKKDSEYIIPDSNSRYLTESDISGLSLQQLNYAKNEIYARRGRKFDSVELQEYFGSKSWYRGCLLYTSNISFFMNSGTVLGYTDGYTSPEQYQRVRNIKEGIRENFVKIDERADLYSLGATLYHIITGEKLTGNEGKPDRTLLNEKAGETFASVIEDVYKRQVLKKDFHKYHCSEKFFVLKGRCV